MKHFFTPKNGRVGSAICWFLFFTIFFQQVSAQETGISALRKMYDRYKNGPCKNYTFSQRNEHYENDTLIGKSVWHESVGYPDRFRILFGDSAKGNMVLFRNDSVYRFKKSAVVKAERDSNNLLLLLGGMYYREFEDVVARLKKADYALDKFSERQWHNRKVLVIGAMAGDDESNQVWVDAIDLRVIRILEKLNEHDQMDMRFEKQQKWCNGFVEVQVSFRRNGLLEQVEEYYDLKETGSFR